jgi:hypothetical protein
MMIERSLGDAGPVQNGFQVTASEARVIDLLVGRLQQTLPRASRIARLGRASPQVLFSLQHTSRYACWRAPSQGVRAKHIAG